MARQTAIRAIASLIEMLPDPPNAAWQSIAVLSRLALAASRIPDGGQHVRLL